MIEILLKLCSDDFHRFSVVEIKEGYKMKDETSEIKDPMSQAELNSYLDREFQKSPWVRQLIPLDENKYGVKEYYQKVFKEW
ncbi:MAG: hypothetical protein NTY03_01295 [Candidatus Bathyarchaeota archaeon]|nr:hypothetical protein [Candidatus Bathyarchaeota archaeon]